MPKDIRPEWTRIESFVGNLADETDRGVALAGSALLDECLDEILSSFLAPVSASKGLLEGTNAPLGSFASRIAAAYALGLIQVEEYNDLQTIRSIRNRFAHSWAPLEFKASAMRELCEKLSVNTAREPSTPRSRFIAAAAVLLSDFAGRARQVRRERRRVHRWQKRRGIQAWLLLEQYGA